MPLNIEQLEKLVAGDTVAIRGTATLEPAGGPGDKIFPPTHAVDDKNKKLDAGAKYRPRSGGGDYYGILNRSAGVPAVLSEAARRHLLAWAGGRAAVHRAQHDVPGEQEFLRQHQVPPDHHRGHQGAAVR